jgi:hypothetical protein
MLIIVGENKKRALLRCDFTGWYYEIFISAQDRIIPTGLSIITERTLDEIVNASEPVNARPEGITRVIHTGAEGDINTINTTEESSSRTKSFTEIKFQLIS